MATTDEQIAQLRAAIVALEVQRPILGKEVVEAGLGPLRQKLAVLEASVEPEQQRKLVTVLFMDIVGHTALIRDLDPEDNMALIDAALARLAEPVENYGGHIARYQGDGFKAVFGLPVAREEDAENAIHAALAIQSLAQRIDAEWKADHEGAILRVRIGIDTGPVFAGGRTEGRDTIKGIAVNLAARLESVAAPGTVLISHHTYRHVRGVFSVQPRESITVKGIEEPVQTYVVTRAKPRAFRMATRGVEGIETRMVGRDYELGLLRDAYLDTLESAETRVVTIFGEAGVGKSRLLYEFDNWLELRPEIIRYFKGRATPHTQNVPYGLFRDLFAFRFEILDSDSAEVALEKFRAGMAGILEAEQSDLVGHWLGFDFSASESVQRMLGNAGFVETARAYLTRYFRALAVGNPVVVLLEDLHWADDQSLDLVAYPAELIKVARLLGQAQGVPLLIVCAGRPDLLERRPGWGEGQALFSRIYLQTLSRRAGVDLVNQLLQRVEDMPYELCDLIVESAEGNPFYVEEMVKMLIEQGVIERGGVGEQVVLPGSSFSPAPLLSGDTAPEEVWRVRLDKLEGLRVPPTLTGLLQARLDSLPRPERETLQRASVVGRFFWDDAVADLLHAEREVVSRTLEAIRGRELIYHREQSSFAQAEEYIFKHALLRDVTYETVLLKRRAEFHGRVARWLEKHAGDRRGEYLSLMAEHYTQAGERDRAAELLGEAGEEALRVGAWPAGRRMLERALALRDDDQGLPEPQFIRAYLNLGQACLRMADFPGAESPLRRALDAAHKVGDHKTQAEALGWLGKMAQYRGEYEQARALLEESLSLAGVVGGRTLAVTLNQMAWLGLIVGDLDLAEACANESQSIALALGDAGADLSAENMSILGNVSSDRDDFAQADAWYQAALKLARRNGYLAREGRLLTALGTDAYKQGDYSQAKTYYQAGLDRYQELGEREKVALGQLNVADIDLRLGDTTAARRQALEGLGLARALGVMPWALFGVLVFGEIAAADNDPRRALALFGLVRAHPAVESQTRKQIDHELSRLALSSQQSEAGLADGAALDFETVVQEILDGKW